eukprot:gnl/TRDRNA2_/TRDRNA2_157599_c0_seq1.p1 gnl/TRDRNA2_/TRDRNA2_157599_c0~~gnl/TRDRNA2_/TRDRNA2_157599_c0_seq1.p1  ORF type:complete len:173 (+),score=25.43 gnl/TRDRNA2_/TRDRNA2_157599_c0_seq1:71-589(+)
MSSCCLCHLLLLLLVAVHSKLELPNLKVDVYRGPTTCDEDDRIDDGKHISILYTASIDASSAVGEPGWEFLIHEGPEPLQYYVGDGEVVAGLDLGLLGLCKGANASIVVPPEMGYGDTNEPHIPDGATLHFDVQVLDVSHTAPHQREIFDKADKNGDRKLSQDELLQFANEL